MSFIQITDENGTREVDLMPVEKYKQELREDIRARLFFKRPQRVEQLRTMSQEQLLHLASILTFAVEEFAQLYDSSFGEQHRKLVDDLREVRQIAKAGGEDLWPELEK